jgi:tRNA (adenine22-N1)-methyltransferase
MRIKSIVDQIIKPNSIVIDVGSDHAHLAINALLSHRASHVYNIEKHVSPLQHTINNLKKHHLTPFTSNILADGLKTTQIKHAIDYCVISGMGAHTIINILNNKNPLINISEFILIPHKQPDVLRAYLTQHGYLITYEQIVAENGVYYALIKVSTNNQNQNLTSAHLYFGPYNLTHPSQDFYQMLIARKNKIISNKLHLLNQHMAKELVMINRYVGG